MKKITVLIFIFAYSALTNASDELASGARYVAQGNTMVANANDAFALHVNPANLLNHTQIDTSELAISFEQIKKFDDEKLESTSALEYLAWYKSHDRWAYGIYYFKSAQPIILTSESLPNNIGYSDTIGISAAYGNLLSDDFDGGLVWGVATTIESVNAKDQDEEEITGTDYDFTYSAKLGYLGTLNFNDWELTSFFNLAASASTENISTSPEYNETTIRPEIVKVGLLAEFTYLDETSYWQLRATAEINEKKATHMVMSTPNYFLYDDDTRFGVEFVINSLSLRAGTLFKNNSKAKKYYSVGLGYSFDRWSIDVSASETFYLEDENQVNLSFTRQLGE